jgi:hypothetical protein
MPLSVVDLYRSVLPKTNCRDCGFPTCLAFASMVVSEKLPIAGCPHLDPAEAARCQAILDKQQAGGKWVRKDPAQEALAWARQRAASMRLEDLPRRIGGRLEGAGDRRELVLPYFSGALAVRADGISHLDGRPLNRWEQVFVYNHLAQGGSREPAGDWQSFKEIPNTVSKVKAMRANVEEPLVERFAGRLDELAAAARDLGATTVSAAGQSADLALRFQALPRVPVLLLFWDSRGDDPFGAEARLLFDRTVTEHLDIESILFLSERIRQLLCGENAG